MPEKAFMYAVPYKYYEKFGVRKYGFHGTSHRYVSEKWLTLWAEKGRAQAYYLSHRQRFFNHSRKGR